MDDIFEKIIKREIPAYIVFEDDIVIAFLTIEPVNEGHTLIVPKKKFKNIFDGDSDTLAHMMKIAQKIAKVLTTELGATGVNLVMNNGEDAGQEVPHAHLHVVPRKSEDNAYQKPKHITSTEEEFLETKEKLEKALL